MNIRKVLNKFTTEKKKRILVALPLALGLVIALIVLSNSKNPLLDGQIRYQAVVDPTTEYCYKQIEVYSSKEELTSLNEKDYIRFLKEGVEAYSDDIGEYVIWLVDSGTGILYVNGDSRTGYYVEYAVEINNHVYVFSPFDARCIVKGTITWDGTTVSYSPNASEPKLGSHLPTLDKKYILPYSEYSDSTSPMR